MKTATAERPTATKDTDEDGRWFRPSPHPHEWPVTGRVWIDMGDVDEGNADILDLARRMTKLVLWSLNGMLVDMSMSVLEPADIRLIQELAWAADMAVHAAGKRYLDGKGQERRPPIEPAEPRAARRAS